MRLVQNTFRQRHGRAEICEVTAHASADLLGYGVASAAEPGEDLSPDRIVPVAERAPDCHRVRTEGPAAQHLVLRAEEHQGVLRVREGCEARVSAEVTGGPLPDIADELVDAERRCPAGVGAGAGRA